MSTNMMSLWPAPGMVKKVLSVEATASKRSWGWEMGTRKSRSPWMISSGCVDALDPGPVVLEELGDNGGLGDAEPLRHSTHVGRATFDDHAPDSFLGRPRLSRQRSRRRGTGPSRRLRERNRFRSETSPRQQGQYDCLQPRRIPRALPGILP